MNTTYCLVYQAGIANVFADVGAHKDPARVLQCDFHTCESFCRGLRHAGKEVRAAWCNQAGDIAGALWNFSDFDLAPFHDSFAKDFIDNVTEIW